MRLDCSNYEGFDGERMVEGRETERVTNQHPLIRLRGVERLGLGIPRRQQAPVEGSTGVVLQVIDVRPHTSAQPGLTVQVLAHLEDLTLLLDEDTTDHVDRVVFGEVVLLHEEEDRVHNTVGGLGALTLPGHVVVHEAEPDTDGVGVVLDEDQLVLGEVDARRPADERGHDTNK